MKRQKVPEKMLTHNETTRKQGNIMPATVVKNVHSYYAIKLKQIISCYHKSRIRMLCRQKRVDSFVGKLESVLK